jgi:hypothetical protein
MPDFKNHPEVIHITAYTRIWAIKRQWLSPRKPQGFYYLKRHVSASFTVLYNDVKPQIFLDVSVSGSQQH